MKKIKSIGLTLALPVAVVVLFTGCIKNPEISKQFTSSNIGCETKDIQIFNETADFNGMHTWTAECKGKRYLCTYHSTAGSKCKEMIK